MRPPALAGRRPRPLGAAIYREPELGLMLTAVEFRSATRLHVTSITDDGRRTADLPWRE